jgi:outer membrane putative beta-barrel porin/alpha-amylase
MVNSHANRRCYWVAVFCLSLGTTPTVFGQGPPQQLQQGAVVTGHCHGHESEPGCVLPSLFGPNGLTLYNNPKLPHYAHFIGSAQTTLNQTLGTAIATQLAILPIISPASGFTYKYDPSAGAFERSTTTFGPIYTERAETIGEGKFYFGVSYQRFRFDKLDGINLKKVPSVFEHVPIAGEPYESDVIQASNNATLKMDQTMFFGTVGLTNRIDVSLAVPIVSVRMEASSDDQIIRVSGPKVTLNNGMTVDNPHEFNAAGSLTNVYSSTGSATGIGDVTIRLKGSVFDNEKIRIALAMDYRIPTGDARELLGSGSTGIKPFLAISAGGRVSPHVNVGYQWNSRSILAGNLTGTTVSEDPTIEKVVIQNGPATTGHVPSNFFFAGGVDIGLTNRLSLAFDYLGQTVFNAPQVFTSTFVTKNIPGGTGALSLPNIIGKNETMTLNSGAAGLKLNLFGGLLLTADVLFRMDNNGLRQDVTPLIALSRTFGK